MHFLSSIYTASIYSFGLSPNIPLNVPTVHPNQSFDVSLPLNTNGPVQRMEPPNNLQVCVFHFSY